VVPADAPADTWGAGPGESEEPALSPPPNATRAVPGREPEVAAAASEVAPPLVYTLEAIEVRGNARTQSRVVLRYVPFRPGDVFDVDDPEVELTRYRLLGTGFFKDVQFSLRKGSRRGQVVLAIEVVERNTIIVNDVWLGISADADTEGHARPLTAYGGVDVAETNLFGTGITLGSAIGLGQDQLALRLRFLDPAFFGRGFMTNGTLLFNDARDFFGNAGVLYADPEQASPPPEHAVVRYERLGGSLGVGRDLSVAAQAWLYYRFEAIDASYPLAASHRRGSRVEPIDFDVIRGRSVLSALRATLQLDTRDHPFLPTRGWFATATSEVAVAPLGSDYGYQRLELAASRWWRLPYKSHVLRLELFAGAITGSAPFFEQYYVGDFSDFLPARFLSVNHDRRPPPNFLGTQIVEVRYGTYAAKLNLEYRIPLYRGQRSVFGIDFFSSAGAYAVASAREFQSPPPDYAGLALVPLDLTANVGFRVDTKAGGFVLAFSNILGFIPVRGEGPAGE
jgi:outer membrane protein assembly factor BamA